MKYLAITLLTITLAGCSAWKPSLRDVSKLVKSACQLAQLAPDKEFEGKPVSYWCGIAGVALEAADALQDAVEE